MKKSDGLAKLWFVAHKKADIAALEKPINQFKAGLGNELELKILPLSSRMTIVFTISAFFYALRTFRRGDYVMVSSRPLFLPFLIAIISLQRGVPYSLLVIYENNKIPNTERRRRISFFSDFSGLIERWLYKYASKIVVCDEKDREIFEKKTFKLDVPVVMIPFSDFDKI